MGLVSREGNTILRARDSCVRRAADRSGLCRSSQRGVQVPDTRMSIAVLPAVLRSGTNGALELVAAATVCPELLTEDEAIRYLRLDLIDVDDPRETLRRYRKLGLLRGTQVGKCVRYRLVELEAFLARITEAYPR